MFNTSDLTDWCDQVLVSPIIACDIQQHIENTGMIFLPNIDGYVFYVGFYFKVKEHAVLFKLRFSEYLWDDEE